MRLGYDISLSERIKELLDEGTFDKMMDQVVEDMKGELISTLPSESSIRESLYHEIHATARVRIRMQTLINDLVMAEERM